MQEMQVQSLGQEDTLAKEMATHPSILAWKIPRIEEPGGLQSMGLRRVRHNLVTNNNNKLPICFFYLFQLWILSVLFQPNTLG